MPRHLFNEWLLETDRDRRKKPPDPSETEKRRAARPRRTGSSRKPRREHGSWKLVQSTGFLRRNLSLRYCSPRSLAGGMEWSRGPYVLQVVNAFSYATVTATAELATLLLLLLGQAQCITRRDGEGNHQAGMHVRSRTPAVPAERASGQRGQGARSRARAAPSRDKQDGSERATGNHASASWHHTTVPLTGPSPPSASGQRQTAGRASCRRGARRCGLVGGRASESASAGGGVMLVQLCAPWRGAAAKGHAQCPCPGRRTRRRHGDQRLAWLAAALACVGA